MTETPIPKTAKKQTPEPRAPVMWKIESVTNENQTVNIWFPNNNAKNQNETTTTGGED